MTGQGMPADHSAGMQPRAEFYAAPLGNASRIRNPQEAYRSFTIGSAMQNDCNCIACQSVKTFLDFY